MLIRRLCRHPDPQLDRHSDRRLSAGIWETLTVPDGTRCLGYVYIYPAGPGAYDACVHYWVRDSEKALGLDDRLGAFLRRWLREACPFEKVAWPGRRSRGLSRGACGYRMANVGR